MRTYLAISLFGAVLTLPGCDDDPEGSTADTGASDTAIDADTVDPADAVEDPLETDDTIDDSPDTTEDAVDTTPEETSAPDTGWPAVTYADELLEPDPTIDPDHVPLGDLVVTTLSETLRPLYGRRPLVEEDGDLLVPVEELGTLVAQPGEPHLLRDQLAGEAVQWSPGALPEGSRSLLYGLILADPQLVDQDSPAQVHKNASRSIAGISLPAYTPQGEFGVHLVDALVRSADRFQQERPFDVVVIAGDHIENSQANELQQLHTVINGGEVTADSGALDDPIPGPANDAYDPFLAGGLRPGTPWISSIGNHDVNINGNFPPGLVAELNQDAALRATLDAVSGPLGTTFPYEPTADAHPALFPHLMRSAFRVVPDAFHPAMMTSDEELQALVPGPTPPDEARQAMGACGFIRATRLAAGDPPGHGYSQANDENCTGFYLYDPVPGLPIRIVSLDLGPNEGGSQGILAPPQLDGAIDPSRAGDPSLDQVAFLEAALADAEAEGVAVIVLTHQASDSIAEQSQLQDLAFLLDPFPEIQALIDRWSPVPVEPVSSAGFRRLLASSPAVIAHLAGHNHRNRVRAICPDGRALARGEGRCEPGAEGESGYWEVTTAAGIDYPHEARYFEVIHVAGRLGALYLTLQEPRIPAGSLTEQGRFIAVLDHQLGGGRFGGLGAPGDRNVLLPFVLSPAIAANWAGLGASEIESETSLHEALPALPALPVWSD